jgi:aminoglycoside phosphotransferase (APT) family kinase protein
MTLGTHRLLGRGRSADVYEWNECHALKLYHPGWPAASAEKEYQIATAAHAASGAAPAVVGVVQVEGRPGVVYERLDGPSLLNHTTAKPWTVFASARLMAKLHAQMHTCRPAGLPSQRQRLRDKFNAARPLSPGLKQVALAALDQLPDEAVLCHGDYHPDNILLSTRGPVILDWVEATCGHPLADVARTTLMMRHATIPPHVSGRQLIEAGRRLWYQVYLRRYCQLQAVTPQQIDAWLLPVAAARLNDGIPEEAEMLSRLVAQLAQAHGYASTINAPAFTPATTTGRSRPACRTNRRGPA